MLHACILCEYHMRNASGCVFAFAFWVSGRCRSSRGREWGELVRREDGQDVGLTGYQLMRYASTFPEVGRWECSLLY